MNRAVVGVALALAAGCHSAPRSTRPAAAGGMTCADLPGTYRTSLRVGPDGASLYWSEQIKRFGYNDAYPTSRLVRWDLEHAPETLGETLDAPFRVLPDGRVVGLGSAGVWLWDRGDLQLISGHDHVEHLEVAGDDAVVYLTAGAIYLQPLRREAARWLGDADELIGVDGRTVIARRGEGVVGIGLDDGKVAPLADPLGQLLRVDGDAWMIGEDAGVAIQRGSTAQIVLDGDNDLEDHPGTGSVVARRLVGDAFAAAVVNGAGATLLPSVSGADDLVGVVRFPDGRAGYLVGHDTDRDGDVDEDDESDVCIAAAGATAVSVEPRTVPLAYRDLEARIDAVVARLVPGATWSFEGSSQVPGIDVVSADPLRDDGRRATAIDALAEALVGVFGDPALFVDLTDTDGRRAISEWRAWQHRREVSTGAGAALAPSLADADVVVDMTGFVRAADGATSCAGTLVNQTAATLRDVSVTCNDGAAVAAEPATIEPGATARFAATTSTAEGDESSVLVYAGHDLERATDRAGQADRRAVADAAEWTVEMTHLIVSTWEMEDGVMVLVLAAPDGFADYSTTARASAAGLAYDKFEKLGVGLLGAPDGTPLQLRLTADGHTWTSDGGPPVQVR